MTKINPNKRIQRQRTEVDLRKALEVVPESIDVDDPHAVLKDCVEELLDARLLLESVRSFVSVVGPRLQRK